MGDQLLSTRNHIIILDDEPGIISLCQRILERADFRVTTFTDPHKFLAEIEKISTSIDGADLLLVDIRMPGMDGFQVIDFARNLFPDIAILVMTGFGTVETAIEALSRGTDGLILKPFSSDSLVQSVKRALEKSQHKQDILRLQAMRPLFDVSESLFTETNPKTLRNLVLKSVCGHLKCGLTEFYQVEPHNGHSHNGNSVRLRLVSVIHKPPSNVPSKKRSGDTQPLTSESERQLPPALLTEPIALRSATLNAPLIIHQTGIIDPAEEDYQIQKILSNRGLISVICAPVSLKAGALVNGVLLAARKIGEQHFRAADLELLAILARQAAVSLENARLHAELHDYIHQLEDSQRALIQAEKMATAGRLTGSIAHEINNPLQSVQNCLHLASRQELSEEQRQSYLNMAVNELERLMQTVSRMLDFYRPAALDRKPVEINPLLDRVITLIDNQLAENKIQIHRNYAQNLPPVYAVSDQILQVFLNLLLNSMEAMPNGGDIFIETVRASSQSSSRNSDTKIAPTQNEVEIYIEDTGPGIPLAEQKHLFEPFFSTKEKGTGLGLAISYGIVTAHSGKLELVDSHTQGTSQTKERLQNSKTSKGACFKVTIPIVETT